MGEEQFSGRENLGDAEHEGAMRRCSLSLTLALPPSLCPPFIPPPALGGGQKTYGFATCFKETLFPNQVPFCRILVIGTFINSLWSVRGRSSLWLTN